MKKNLLKTASVFSAAICLMASCKKENAQSDADSGYKLRPVSASSSAYVSRLIQYRPAPGQFINATPGNLESAQGILGRENGLVSLGAWGGSITLGFDHSVVNQPGKKDIMIYGNALPTFAEPGVIYVMQDVNGNGLADDTWYELAGSETDKSGYIRNYSITYTRPNPATGDVAWKDNQGKTGVVKTTPFHKQPYYPETETAAEYTLTGVLLPSSNINPNNPSSVSSMPFGFGYADNASGGDKVDVASAIDVTGKKVNLSGIDFIRIQTGIQADMGGLGELSTEISGVADLSLIK